MVTLTPLRKEEKKNKETKPIFESSYLGNALHNFEMWGMTVEGISIAKIV